MPRGCLAGCFHLPCVKKDNLSSDEDSPVKNDLLDLTSEDLRRFTGQFSPENLVGVTHLGKLYRAKLPVGADQDEVTKYVVVKILDHYHRVYNFVGDDKLARFEDELKFLQSSRIRANPNLVKVIGYCREEEVLGIVYDLNPHDTLENLITRADFNWLQRVKAALTLARLLNYLHDRKYLIRNFAPYHIVVDQNFTPIMFEFGLLVGGILGTTVSKSDIRYAPYGYIDAFTITHGPDAFTDRSDVFAFGILLLNLISKRPVEDRDFSDSELDAALDAWALINFKPECSLVHQSLESDLGFDLRDGAKITELAVQCVAEQPKKRPNMQKVVESLEALRVVQEHGEEIK